ncbi:MAG TPA: hypothetical protein ENF41_04385 [Candidatus Bathyarchaeota archaeon]|nr:hypothetical protein [Candidatus Bathyarchaeota archaeon]
MLEGVVIKRGYPLIRQKFNGLADYIALLRPLTILPVIIVSLFGILFQLIHYNQVYLFLEKWNVIIYVAITLALAQGVGQIVNQACEVELDIINGKRYRPIPSGRISREEAFGFALLLTFFCIGRAFTINLEFGLLMMAILFFSIFYTLKPLYIKRFFILNILWISISRGLLAMLAIWSVFGNIADLYPYIFGLIATSWCLSFNWSKDFPDVKGDKMFGIKTFPVVLGVRKAQKLYTYMSILPFITMTVFTLIFLPLKYLLLIPILAPFAILSVKWIRVESQICENNLGWLMFYLGLGVYYIVLPIIEVI